MSSWCELLISEILANGGCKRRRIEPSCQAHPIQRCQAVCCPPPPPQCCCPQQPPVESTPVEPEKPPPVENTPDEEPIKSDTTDCMVKEINALRLSVGKDPVEVSPHLNVAAQRHANDMLARDYSDHVARAPAPNGAMPGDRAASAGFPDGAGENISFADTCEGAFKNWLETGKGDVHYDNMVATGFKSIGIGYSGPTPKSRWVLMFSHYPPSHATGPVPPV